MMLVVVKVNVFKAPVTDPGKNSKKGRLKLVKDSRGCFHTEQEIPSDSYRPDDPTVSSARNYCTPCTRYCDNSDWRILCNSLLSMCLMSVNKLMLLDLVCHTVSTCGLWGLL